jgi:signal transduction histidine kinase/DNA-binding response OmpR family regulator
VNAPLLTLEIRFEHDVVFARQRARQIAALLGFDNQDQARIATAVSEIARNVVNYAQSGRILFRVEGATAPQVLVMEIVDQGPGIPNLKQVLSGQYRSQTGMGLGLVGARRLMDWFKVESEAGRGTTVWLKKILSPTAPLVTPRTIAHVAEELSRLTPQNAFEEVKEHNRELMRALDELKTRQDELVRLNEELQDTNRGVLALYTELDEQADHLRRADEMKSRFLSNMSHEFRTPLNSIMALARILQDHIDGPLTPEQEKQVGFIRKAAESLTELVNDLLDLAKVEAGKVEIYPVEFSVADLFGALRGMLRPLLVGDAVRLVFDDVTALPTVVGDDGKISQILRNFISNALKFTERGEIRVAARSRPEAGTVVFSVADTGIGIAPEDQKRIFGEYQQVEHPIQKRVKGTGLGLPLSRKLAELLQGTISLESTPGVGSTFSLEVPRAFRPPLPPEPAAVAERAPRDPFRLPVLVVEDAPEEFLVYEALLRNTEFQIVPASTVVAARQVLRDGPPSALVLDIQLRGQDSWAFLAELKNGEWSDLPVLVVTNVADEVKALGLGADAYFPKPLERPWLVHTLRSLTRSARRVVLAIDDDELSRYTLQDALRGLAFEFREAASGEEGLARARQERPSAVFLDLNMPDPDGFTVLARLKSDEATRDIPVIVVTSKVLTSAEKKRLGEAAAVIGKESVARGEGREEIRRALLRVGLGDAATAAPPGA